MFAKILLVIAVMVLIMNCFNFYMLMRWSNRTGKGIETWSNVWIAVCAGYITAYMVFL